MSTVAEPLRQSAEDAGHGLTGPGIARRARSAAAASERDLPALGAAGHLRDGADAAEDGNWAGVKRHLRAAMAAYAPVSVIRHGLTSDADHIAARQHLSTAHRLHLQVQEAEPEQGR